MQEDNLDAIFGKRGVAFGDGVDEVIEFADGFDAAEPGTSYDKRQKLLANAWIGFHVGSLQHRDDVVAQVQSVTQAFHCFTVLRKAGQRG